MPEPFTYDPPMDPIAVLHEDADLLFVDKPSGLLSVPGRLAEHKDSLLNRLVALNGNIRLVHRLDMDTSGVMVFAKTAAAQRGLGRLFEARAVAKVYLAEVSGVVAGDEGAVDLPLMVDWPNRPLQKVDAAGKPARTKWRVLQRGMASTVMELRPETGRSHQLRVHMAQMGHAILGDRFYADPKEAESRGRLLLHAYSLQFKHPVTLDLIRIVAPCGFFEMCPES